jgi:SNF2 family DNA or RNA helicase
MQDLKKVWPSAQYAEHQEDGIRWMLEQEENGYEVRDTLVRGGILGDEMGLGKTIQSLALIVNGVARRTLIITPLAVRGQWEEAALRCNLNVYVAEKNGWVLKTKNKIRKEIFIGHYDKVVSSESLFREFSFDRIILDEAHRIRNAGTATYNSILGIKATYKWALTATPIVNSLDDAVSYLHFLGFPISDTDSKKWSSSYEPWIQNIYLARTLNECEAPAGLTMPPPTTTEERLLEFTDKDEEKLYNGILSNIESQWRKAKVLKGQSYTLQMLSVLLRLRQVSVNPAVYIKAREKEAFGWEGPEFRGPSRKFEEIINLLRESHESRKTHRWIIFCQFKDEIELLNSYLKAFSFVGSVLDYHG